MHARLLAAAAIAAANLSPVPAAARHHSSGGPHFRSPHWVDGSDRFRRDGRRCRDDGCGGWAYADGDWALANNRSWAPDSFNDWWNDRPDRAFPRWVQEQQARGTCDPDRMWWSGSGWHC